VYAEFIMGFKLSPLPQWVQALVKVARCCRGSERGAIGVEKVGMGAWVMSFSGVREFGK